jgi:hypothetical protein
LTSGQNRFFLVVGPLEAVWFCVWRLYVRRNSALRPTSLTYDSTTANEANAFCPRRHHGAKNLRREQIRQKARLHEVFSMPRRTRTTSTLVTAAPFPYQEPGGSGRFSPAPRARPAPAAPKRTSTKPSRWIVVPGRSGRDRGDCNAATFGCGKSWLLTRHPAARRRAATSSSPAGDGRAPTRR